MRNKSKLIEYENLGWEHPFQGRANLIDLLYALYERLGVKRLPNSSNSYKISQLIPKSKKYVFILIDGMGLNLLKKTLPQSFLFKNVKLSMNTIFPSSTGTVLTSIATALLPEKHSINGWFSYDKRYDESFTTLPFMNRFDNKTALKTPFESVFYAEQVFKQIPIQTNVILPEVILNSTFSSWKSGGRDSYGYADFKNAFEVLANLLVKDEPSFTYVYFSQYDEMCHKFGTNSKESISILEDLNRNIEEFSNALPMDSTVIITADHGQVDINSENFNVILPDDKLCGYFYAPPGGDARVTSFYVKEEYQNKFVEEFKDMFGDKCVLMSIDEVNKECLLGCDGLENIAREKFGNYLAIWKEDYAFKYAMELNPTDKLDIGNHGGLTKDEMEIPLIIF